MQSNCLGHVETCFGREQAQFLSDLTRVYKRIVSINVDMNQKELSRGGVLSREKAENKNHVSTTCVHQL